MYSEEYYHEAQANDMDWCRDYDHMCMSECVPPAPRISCDPNETAPRPSEGPDAGTDKAKLLSMLKEQMQQELEKTLHWHNKWLKSGESVNRIIAKYCLDEAKYWRKVIRMVTS